MTGLTAWPTSVRKARNEMTQQGLRMIRIWIFMMRALPAFLVLAGCTLEPRPSVLTSTKDAFDELRAAVREEVGNPVKANEVEVLVDQLEQIMIEANEARKAHIERMGSLNANYDATEEEFRAAFADFNAKQRSRQDRILAIDQRARELTTDREWKALSRDVAHALEASARSELGM